MLETLQNIDSSIFLFFNGHHNPFFDSFMSLYSGRYIWIPMYAALLIVMLRRFPIAKVLLLLVGIGTTIFIADQLCASVIRPIFERMRPSNLSNPLSELTHIVNGYRGGPYGFPSCHAANSFALATFAAIMLRQRGFTLFILTWAAINCYSRIYLGVHYPGDLIVGGLIGAAVGMIWYFITNGIYQALLSAGKIKPTRPPLYILPSFRGGINLVEVVGVITLLIIIFISL
ncbi:MAG: phosphatase PAP2 family protein [Muribaculaceae bacterium]|nr:phosphatase PAP2 family protein [Muribaculaceae bacterium]